MSGIVREDRRVTRTRGALIGAFNRLFLSRRRGPLRVAEIVAEADVGRSTFYEHFRGANDLYLEALKRPFAVLADAAAGCGEPEALARLVGHFWENRQRARETLSGPLGERAARLLAAMVEERLGDAALSIPHRLAARMLADAALAPLRPWLFGEAAAAPHDLALALVRAGDALRTSLSR